MTPEHLHTDYIDDWSILAQSEQLVVWHLDVILAHMKDSSREDHLSGQGVGFVESILATVKRVREGQSVTMKLFQKLLGLMADASNVITFGLMHMRPLQWWLRTRVGYRNPVPIRHRYLCNRYVLEPNQNADFGAMPERSVEIFALYFSETDIRSIFTGTTHEKLFPD